MTLFDKDILLVAMPTLSNGRFTEITFPDRRFPDVARTRRFPDKTFLGESFPGQFVQIIFNTLEWSRIKRKDELSCAPCMYDYMLLVISLVFMIFFLSLLRQFASHSSCT